MYYRNSCLEVQGIGLLDQTQTFWEREGKCSVYL